LNHNPGKPRISVVVPLHNKEIYIERAISSIINQSVTSFEIIVVDDGSTDGSCRKVNQINDQRLRLFTQENMGVSSARNRGIAEAKADLIAFLDADDEYKPDFLKSVLKLKEQYPKAKAFGTGYAIIEKNGKTRSLNFEGIPNSPWNGILENYFLSATNLTPFCSSSIALLKSVFSDIGYFKESINLGEDLEMWIRVAINYPIAYSNEIQAKYHYEPVNRASENGFNGSVPFDITIKKAIESGQINKSQINDALEFLARHQLEAVFHNLKAGDRESALSILNSVRYTRKFRSRWIWRLIWCNLPESIFYFILNFKRNLLITIKSL
jgi:glycosyltransferase involved in cell wall biosynthesis